MRRSGLAALIAASALLPRLYAPPPLVTGDVPVAEQGHFELFTGFRFQNTGVSQRQLPHIELVYGIADRWEVVELNMGRLARRKIGTDATAHLREP